MKTASGLFGALLIAGTFSTGLADEHPQGRIDCHVAGDPDSRVNVLLAEIGHGRSGEPTKDIPVGCNRCHAEDDEGTAGPLRRLMHSIHYEMPEEDKFVTDSDNECLHCHVIDTKTGNATVKSAERNWEARVIASD